jgi:hypothetical protein
MNFISNLNYTGIILAVLTFVIIGIFHPIVIKAEYYWSKKCWWIFCIVGIVCIISSLFIHNDIISPILGVFGVTCLWSIKEVFEQEERVRKGWFPKNPKRKYPF